MNTDSIIQPVSWWLEVTALTTSLRCCPSTCNCLHQDPCSDLDKLLVLHVLRLLLHYNSSKLKDSKFTQPKCSSSEEFWIFQPRHACVIKAGVGEGTTRHGLWVWWMHTFFFAWISSTVATDPLKEPVFEWAIHSFTVASVHTVDWLAGLISETSKCLLQDELHLYLHPESFGHSEENNFTGDGQACVLTFPLWFVFSLIMLFWFQLITLWNDWFPLECFIKCYPGCVIQVFPLIREHIF